MLDDVNVVIGHRRVVQVGNVPSRNHQIERDKTENRPRNSTCNRGDDAISEKWSKHPSWNSRDEQRRHRKREQKMLHHVSAEEIIVAQIVQRSVERNENDEKRREE